MKYVFIDTNIWLSLYHFSNDSLNKFEELKDYLGKSIKLIIPKQVYNEIIRNREAKIEDALKNFEFKIPKFPEFCKGYEEYAQLKNEIDSTAKRFKKYKVTIDTDIECEELPADKTLRTFFSATELYPCDDYVEKAYHRYRIGNPPGKDNKYGDAINWECLLDVVPENEDLYFISGDKDYRSLISKKRIKPFLAKEWKEKKKAEVHFYSTLTEFLNENVKDINLQDEIEKENLIDSLNASCTFMNTHAIISQLQTYSGWTMEQIEKLCAALIDNNQVSWIIGDPDIYEFYNELLSNIDANSQNNSILKKAQKKIEEVEV